MCPRPECHRAGGAAGVDGRDQGEVDQLPGGRHRAEPPPSQGEQVSLHVHRAGGGGEVSQEWRSNHFQCQDHSQQSGGKATEEDEKR